MSSPIGSLKSSQKIINLIRENNKITIKEISNIIDISERAVKKHIYYLKEKNEIRRVGSNRGGHWKINQED